MAEKPTPEPLKYVESTWKEEEEPLMCCALRFHGYKFEEATRPGVNTGHYLSELMDPVVKTLVLHDDDLQNFAAFFGLQRWLGKWGGDCLPPESREHLAYRFLFLHLYRKRVPEEYQHEEYVRRWRTDFEARAEHHAARIRDTFMRKTLLPA